MEKISGNIRCNMMLILTFILLPMNLQSQTQDDYLVGREYWMHDDYQKAYEHLIRFRETTYGRNVEVDFMLGTSGCCLHDPKMNKWGCNVLDWILHRYDLSNYGKQIVSEQLERCQSVSIPPVSKGSLAEMTSIIGASASVWGSKMYYWIGQDEAFNNYRAVFLHKIPKDSLRARLFSLGDSAKARQQIFKQFTRSRILVSSRIIFVTWTNHNNEMLKQMAAYLETYLHFLEHQYGLTLPSDYITIYLVPSSDELQNLSMELHGIRMSRTAFGYSFRDDLSVVAAVPEGFTIGTMMHELFHLVVRSTFGDIPLWLDEGIASLYEVSKFVDTAVLGIPNWRGDLLKRLSTESSSIWPNLDRLITSNWFTLEQPGTERDMEYPDMPTARQLAAMLATARYFALYAQEKGKLCPLYFAFQKWDPSMDTSGTTYERKAIERVENVFGSSITNIDHEFRSWFRAIPKHR